MQEIDIAQLILTGAIGAALALASVFIFPKYLKKSIGSGAGESVKAALETTPPYVAALIIVYTIDKIFKSLHPSDIYVVLFNIALLIVAVFLILRMTGRIRNKIYKAKNQTDNDTDNYDERA